MFDSKVTQAAPVSLPTPFALTRAQWFWLLVLVVTVAVRMGTLGAYPLADSTEARYSEVARLMLQSGDWVTPQIREGIPFWGKPPLSFWATAGSFKLFGLNEFAARFPSFLFSLGAALIVFLIGTKHSGRTVGLAASAIFMSSGLGFVSAGAVMTDPALVFGTTLALAGFWRAVAEKNRFWGFMFFAGVAIGLLAKGPLALILIATPIFAWASVRRQWLSVLRNLPWISGITLMLMCALPWYVMAEIRTPGFLNYFLIGEHFLRFVDSGWQGDLYGSAHARARGTIWIYALISLLPWSFVALAMLRPKHFLLIRQLSDWHLFLTLWALTPLLFFTFAGNILPAYVLPAAPAFALLLSGWMNSGHRRYAMQAAWVVPAVFVVLGPNLMFDKVAEKSAKPLVATWSELAMPSSRLLYFDKKPFSADFYSQGEAGLVDEKDISGFLLSASNTDYLAVKNKQIAKLPIALAIRLSTIEKYPRYTLYRVNANGNFRSGDEFVFRNEAQR